MAKAILLFALDQLEVSALKKSSNPPSSPFVKRGKYFSSLWQREVGRDFMMVLSKS